MARKTRHTDCVFKIKIVTIATLSCSTSSAQTCYGHRLAGHIAGYSTPNEGIMADLPLELPPGSILEHYRIERTLSAGGFSIVYLAVDLETDTAVVIKEYLPQRLAQRMRHNKVMPLKPSLYDAFKEGRKLFFQEASTLAKLKHPNIVAVNNFFNANDTVYTVMEYKPGKNLQSYIKKYQGKMSENFLRTIFPPLCDGLIDVHKAGLLHLDIKPGNIHLQPGGQPLLLDFGAVQRMQVSRILQPLPVVTQGFSPIEQHGATGYLGPWTDIYALGATLRACIEGTSPPDAQLRYEHDTLKPAHIAFKRKYSPSLLLAIDKAMEVDPVLRPQSIEQFLELFNAVPHEDPEPSVLDKLVGTIPWRGGH